MKRESCTKAVQTCTTEGNVPRSFVVAAGAVVPAVIPARSMPVVRIFVPYIFRSIIMKTTSAINAHGAMRASLALLCMLFLSMALSVPASARQVRTDTLNVSGNCGTCKKKIEAPFKGLEGVESASWDKKTKKFVVQYDADVISREKIEDLIVQQGYDTEAKKANDEVYNALPKCCKYRTGTCEH
jgi:copper chaperone CopZ